MAHWLKVLDVFSEDWSGVHTSGAVTNAHNSSSRDRMSSGWTCMCACAHTEHTDDLVWSPVALVTSPLIKGKFLNSSAREFVRCWEAWRRLCEYQPLLLMVSCPSRQRPQNPKAYVEPAYGYLCVAFLSSVLDFTFYPVVKRKLKLFPAVPWTISRFKMLGSVGTNSGSRYTHSGEFWWLIRSIASTLMSPAHQRLGCFCRGGFEHKLYLEEKQNELRLIS